MSDEKVYQFNEYVLGYDKGLNDRSCLTISKMLNGNIYVMSFLYDGSADIISNILDNLQQRLEYLERSNNRREENITSLQDECTELEQENERLKDELERLHNLLNSQAYKDLDDYKSRCEKAIEYIKTKKAIINTDYIRIFDLFEIDEQGYIDNLLNILQGGKDDNN